MAGESQAVERIDREEGLSWRRRARTKAMAVPRVARPRLSQPGLGYARDVVHARLANGQRFTCVTMTDLGSKDVPVIAGAASIGGERVCRILDRLFTGRPLPETVIRDNGPAFAGTAWDAWAGQHGGKPAFHPTREAGPACV
jgi:putative transposase